MFRFGKYVAGGVAAAVVVGLLVLGPGRMATTIGGARERLKSTVEERKSDAQLAAELAVLLQQMDAEIDRYAGKLADLEDRRQGWGRRREKIGRGLAEEELILREAKEMLESERTTFEIGDQRYSREEVQRDAEARLTHSQRLREESRCTDEVVGQLERSMDEGQEALSEAQSRRQEMAAKQEMLKARLSNARMRAQVADAVEKLRDSPLNPQTTLAQKMEAFEGRVRSVERYVERRTHQVQSGMVVDWDGNASDKNTVHQIAEFLGDEPQANVADMAADSRRVPISQAAAWASFAHAAASLGETP